ncbi:MAG: NifB/NifX family molybdenum-iron cluster-binding protein [Bryobacterales bacterium]|nr:NifB/NifX family molybdenum-iron cluster-binding protein [Bryobacterales bacterium]
MNLRIALPLAGGQLSAHFGHCEKFAFIDVDYIAREVLCASEVDAPEHEPGLLPRWLRERGVNLVIASGIGARATRLLNDAQIGVLTGAPAREPAALVRDYLDGRLTTGRNACDH